MLSYAVLLAVALVLNLRDRKMLTLTALVGVGVFAQVPDAYFYLVCALGELLIALIAIYIAAPASGMIVRISTVLVGCHFLGYLLNGYPQTSPYHILVKLCEHAEIGACILFSRALTRKSCYERDA